jgi:hypothetical protein
MLRGEPSPKHAIAQIIAHKSAADLLAGALSLSLSLFARLKACVGSSRMRQPQRRRRTTGVASDDKVGRKRKTAIILPSESTTFVNCRPRLQFLVYKRQRKSFSSVISTRNCASQSTGFLGQFCDIAKVVIIHTKI